MTMPIRVRRLPAVLSALGAAAFGAAFLGPSLGDGSRLTASLAAQSAADPCAGARDLRLTNGKIVTMDARGTIAREASIQNGRFTAVAPEAASVSASAPASSIWAAARWYPD